MKKGSKKRRLKISRSNAQNSWMKTSIKKKYRGKKNCKKKISHPVDMT